MTIELVTGVPGAGKTLYTLSKKVKPLLGKKIVIGDCLDNQTGKPLEVERRLMICGVRDLLLPHELVDVAPSHEPWEASVRHPGEPPHDVPHLAQNWWLWCQPGDVIVIDECQRVFRPSPAGQKIPAFIRHLETHRHYGVDFIIITQHPQLIHSNVRNLIGHHEHVRRIFGGAGTMVYEWDHCTHPDRTKQATGRIWRHDKKAFSLYKSAEVHTKVKHKVPGAVMLAVAGFVALPVAGYYALDRMKSRFKPPEAASAVASASSPASSSSSIPSDDQVLASSTQNTVTSSSNAAPLPQSAASSVVGCVSTSTRCRCIDSNGEWLTTELKSCQFNSKNLGALVRYPVVQNQVSRYSTAPASSSPDVSSGSPSYSLLDRAQSDNDQPAHVVSAFADGHIRR